MADQEALYALRFDRLSRDWQETQRSQLDVPSGRIVSSFTDQAPAHGWDATHCLRELWQNFRDGLRERFCSGAGARAGEFCINVCREEEGLFKAWFGNQEVGYLSLQTEHRIEISQRQCLLGLEALQLASRKQSADGSETIGGHGEGFKLAINKLLQMGYEVTYTMSCMKWTFLFANVYGKCRNMCIDVEVSDSPRDDLLITIQGKDAHRLFDPSIDVQLTRGLHTISRCKDGAFHSSDNDDALHGRVYCRGLFVATDDTFKTLQLAVNLNTNVARDRHLLPGNTWELIQRMLEEVARRRSDDDLRLIDHLVLICRTRSAEQLARSLPYIKPPIRRFIATQNGVSMSSVVFLESDASPLQGVLKDLGKFVVDGAGALADPVDAEEMKRRFISNAAVVKLSDLTDEERKAHTALQNLEQAIKESFDRHCQYTVVVKEIPESMKESLPTRTHDMKVVVSRSMLRPGEVGFAGCTLLMRWGFGQDRLQALLVMEFAKDPLGFVGKRYHVEGPAPSPTPASTAAAATAAAAKAGPSVADPDTIAFAAGQSAILRFLQKREDLNGQAVRLEQFDTVRGRWRVRTAAGECLYVRPENMQSLAGAGAGVGGAASYSKSGSLVPNPVVKSSAFKGVPLDELPACHEDDREVRCQCRPPTGVLLPFIIGDITIYFSDRVMNMQRDKAFMRKLGATAPVIFAFVTCLQERICRALSMEQANMQVVLVVVDPSLLAFTLHGGIYLNCLPLVDLDDVDRYNSIYLSLMHELTHRAHKNHDTEFAHELVRLVIQTQHAVQK